MVTRIQILVRGIVQGVGLRPYIFSLAERRSLKGRVFNSATGVVIDIEGSRGDIEQFINEVMTNPPPLSVIESIEPGGDLPPMNYIDFLIVESTRAGHRSVPVSADFATCEDCLRELFDPKDRRYRYPFINCTNCGPRFTIIEDVPYDRANTTMREFTMCDDCRAEYEDPLDRRFHAEPIACPACGPQLRLVDSKGREIALDGVDRKVALSHAQSQLSKGGIIALKSIGGFHLVCDATAAGAVERLRRKKHREEKPFALMASSVQEVKKYCFVSKLEEDLLISRQRPIVLLEKRPDSTIPHAAAPGVNTLGFMLPYSPLHHLLVEDLDRPVVMTSGNVSDEPICYEDQDALRRLSEIADCFLLHNRRIHTCSDDSVARVFRGSEMLLRRSRGYAPAPVKTAFQFEKEILACGAELKNTFCLAHNDYAFVSHHIGDLENLETLHFFRRGIKHYKQLFDIEPGVVAYDLHPEYLSTKYALSLDDGLIKVGVQHHHAHIASCMVDNQIEGDVIGVAMDGLGFGLDGRLWGGEFFVANFIDAERIAHLDYMPMPGGAKAIREPWRMAAVYLQRALGDEFLKLDLPFVHKLDRRAWAALKKMAATGINSPDTSSMGRLFDAVSSLLGLRDEINYEGQAAIELESIADRSCNEGYEFEVIDNGSIIRAEAVIRRAVEDLLNGVSSQTVSAKFHFAIANLVASIAHSIKDERRLNRVVLSGGVFQNMLILEKTSGRLVSDGFDVFTHSRVPPNDGGISLGQATVANARIKSGRV